MFFGKIKKLKTLNPTLVKKWAHNPRYNILELSNVLVSVRVTTSKARLGIYYNKAGVQVASRVAERLKTWYLRKLGHIRTYSLPEIKLW